MTEKVTFYIALLAIFAAYLVTGTVISTGSHIFQSYFTAVYGGRPLAGATVIFLPYALSNWPIILSVLAGLFFVSFIIYLRRSKSRYILFWISVAWIPCLLHIATAWVAFTISFVLLNPNTRIPAKTEQDAAANP